MSTYESIKRKEIDPNWVTPDAASIDAVWRATVIDAVNESLGTDLTRDSAAYTVANSITNGISDMRKWWDQAADIARSVTAERDELAGKLADAVTDRDSTQVTLIGARSLYGTLLDSVHNYHQTLGNRLGLPYDTVKDAAALCDAIAPGIAQLGACRIVIGVEAGDLPDVLPPDEDGHPPSPAYAIRRLADALRTARAEADALRSTLATSQARLSAAGRAHDSWRDAAGTSARALSLAASALADVAAIR
jgi:hypothetical protein